MPATWQGWLEAVFEVGLMAGMALFVSQGTHGVRDLRYRRKFNASLDRAVKAK